MKKIDLPDLLIILSATIPLTFLLLTEYSGEYTLVVLINFILIMAVFFNYRKGNIK